MDILDQNIAEAKKVAQDKDVKTRDGTQPKKYFDKKGDDKLAKSTKQDRARHFEKGASKDDDDSSAYEPAPGDAQAKTKPSKHTKKFKKMFGEDAVAAARLKANQADEQDRQKDKHEREVEKLKQKHEKENDKQKAEDEKEKENELMQKQREAQREEYIILDEEKMGLSSRLYKQFKKDIDKIMKKHDAYVSDSNSKYTQISSPKPLDAGFKKDLFKLLGMTEEIELEEESAADKSLKKKADKTGISMGILKQVYKRGVAAWRTGHRPGTTPEQWGHARVNSFITKGSGTWGKADKDLADKVRGESIEERHSDVMRKRNQSQQKAHQKAMMKSAKKSIKDYDARNKNKNEEKLEEACWDGYVQKGFKMKNGKQVPNCVPISEVNEGKLVTGYHDIIDLIQSKIKKKIEKEYEKSSEKGLKLINDLGSMIGHKATDKAQEKGKLFLKFGEEMMPGKGNVSDDGVCELGTDDIRKKYQADTPGQSEESYIKETEKAFHEQQKRTKKNFKDVFGNPLKGYPANEEFEVLDK